MTLKRWRWGASRRHPNAGAAKHVVKEVPESGIARSPRRIEEITAEEPKGGLRVVVDINVLVSAAMGGKRFIRGKYAPGGMADMEYAVDASKETLLLRRTAWLRLVVTEELLDEWDRVRLYPKFGDLLSAPHSEGALIDAILNDATLYTPVREIAICRDPKDNYLLAAADVSNADYLITQDSDLLTIGRIGGTQIVTPDGFFDLNRDLL